MSESPDLSRFVSAQDAVYPLAYAELRRGRKETHWMWFIFPQIAGLGQSLTARRFAIRDLDEARGFLEHPLLGPRLLECCEAILATRGKSAHEILGSPDDLKLRSSMTLFAAVPRAPGIFKEVLEKFYAGDPDPKTLELLHHPSPQSAE